MIQSLEEGPAKAKEAPSPHEVRLTPLDTNSLETHSCCIFCCNFMFCVPICHANFDLMFNISGMLSLTSEKGSMFKIIPCKSPNPTPSPNEMK